MQQSHYQWRPQHADGLLKVWGSNLYLHVSIMHVMLAGNTTAEAALHMAIMLQQPEPSAMQVMKVRLVMNSAFHGQSSTVCAN